jgi:hypothetical protein
MSERPRPPTPGAPSDPPSETRAVDTREANGDGGDIHSPTDRADGEATLVAFVREESIESARFLSWLNLNDGIDVLLVSDTRGSALDADSLLAKGDVPVVADPDGFVADEYGVDFDDLSTGTIVLIDSTDHIRQTWSTDIDPMDIYVTVKRQLEIDHPTDGGDTR